MVQIFTFLLLNNSLLTHDNMLKRGMMCEEECVMCSSCHQETVLHVFFFPLSVCYSNVELHGVFTRGSGHNTNDMRKIDHGRTIDQVCVRRKEFGLRDL